MNEGDIRDLASLHIACVKDSLVTRLGVNYARSFYRYLERSPKELLWVRRDAESRVIAANVFTLAPDTLNMRLLLHTPLAWYFILNVFEMASLAIKALKPEQGESGKVPDLDLPEWIMLFTAESQRGSGLGASMIKEMEDELRVLGVKEYVGKTNADPANKAIAFHLKHGCKFSHYSMVRGKRNYIFTKIVPD